MRIVVANYPQLRQLCWNRPANTVLDGDEALAVYERNWRFVDESALDADERALIARLVAQHGNGVLLTS